MPTIGFVVHGGRADARKAAVEAAALLEAAGERVVACAGDTWAPEHLEVRQPSAFSAGLDVVCVFGGDGTYLRAAYLCRDSGVPLLGVNLGRLGFLTEVELADVPEALRRIAAGDFTVEERMTLSVQIRDASGRTVATTWALNEASVERTVPQRLIVIEVRVGDAVFAHIPADAIVLATPTGSTAYAFSAGGPILSPRVEAILLVPVAAHSLFNRTLVVDPAETLVLSQIGGDTGCVVGCDGREPLPVPPGGSVCVSRGDVPVRMVRLGPFDFYERVRDKFGLR